MTGFDLALHVRQLTEATESRHQEIDDLRRLPADVAETLIDNGIYRIWVPHELGGAGLTARDGLRAIAATARVDGACGWCAMIGATTTLLAGVLPEHGAREIFGDPRAVVGGHTTPVGRARHAEGGIVVDADWSWGSGIHHSTSMGGGAVLDDHGTEVEIFVVVPRGDLTVHDTWHTVGMRGTGSTTYSVHDHFVPDGHWVRLGSGDSWLDHPLYRMPTIAMLAAGVSSVGLGLGQRALDEFRSLVAREPQLLGAATSLGDTGTVQAAFAHAEAAVLAAEALLDAASESAWEQAMVGTVDREARRGIRLAASNAARSSLIAAQQLHLVAGAAVIHTDHPFQRVLRDLHVVSQHIRISDRTWEMIGAHALNRPYPGRL